VSGELGTIPIGAAQFAAARSMLLITLQAVAAAAIVQTLVRLCFVGD
jgi:hypothetical protein